MLDAVVIGAGPNGLVAANLLASAGWHVLVLEAQSEPGEAVRTRELIEPGLRNDMFSAFYPMAAASPAMLGSDLELHQLLVFRPVPGWGRPETPVAGLYLASASAHPGGAVHGACGANAAFGAGRIIRRLATPRRTG